MEKLAAASRDGIYCIDEKKVILARQRKGAIQGLLYHNCKLYDGGKYSEDTKILQIYDTLSSTPYTTISSKDNHASRERLELKGLISSPQGIYAGVEHGSRFKLVQLPEINCDKVEADFNSKATLDAYTTYGVTDVSSHLGKPCIASRVSRISSTVETIDGKHIYSGWPVNAITSTPTQTYLAYSSFGQSTIVEINRRGAIFAVAERKSFVTALAVCNGKLYDSVQVEAFKQPVEIFETEADLFQTKVPIAKIPSYVHAMVSIPEELWNKLAEDGKEI